MLVAGLLMCAALAASLLAGRLRVPGLLLFLVLGMAIGSDGLGWVQFDDYAVARDLGIVALAVILYEGGLTTDVRQLRQVAGAAASLAVLGTLLTAAITGLAASWLLDLSLPEGMLLGAIVASTDVAAIFALLRGSGLQPRLARLLEGEAGSNDPVAILLVIGLIEWIVQPSYGVADMLVLFAEQVVIGLAAGVGVGWLAAAVLRRAELPTVGLYPVASLTAGFVAFGAADVLGGSGFLAIYLTGLSLSRADIPAWRTITAFHDGLAWVAQLTMFLTLGLLVFPSQFASVALEGTLLALVLTFVARPVAIAVSAAFVSLTFAERVVLGWAGLRGAVPVVLATFPVLAGIPSSLEFFNIVFFAVLLSLLIQGTTFVEVARRLGLTTPGAGLPEPIVEVATLRRLGAEVVEHVVREGDAACGMAVRDLRLPHESVLNVIVRGEQAIPPRGSTRVRPGDRLHVLIRREAADEAAAMLRRWRDGPLEPPPRPRRRVAGSAPVFSVLPDHPRAVGGDAHAPRSVLGVPDGGVLRGRGVKRSGVVAGDDGR
jgi:cell volume regulation protein A